MSQEERSGQDNAIWLCSNCATLIDRDEGRFPAELLREWKEQAEARAKEELGRPPQEPDAIHQVVAALTGQAPRYMVHAIPNVHRAMELALERLDPRFRVTSEFSEGRTHFTLDARETVRFKARVGPASAQAWVDGMRNMLEHGQTVVLPMDGVSFDGSALLKEIAGEGPRGSITIAPHGRKAALRLTAQGSDDCPSVFERVVGTVVPGATTVRFDGTGLDDLVRIEMAIPRDRSRGDTTNITINFDLSAWANVDVCSAPNVDRLAALLENLVHHRSNLNLALELEGNEALRFGSLGREVGAFSAYLTFVNYVQRARTIARALQLAIPIDLEASFTGEQHAALADAADLFEKKEWRYSDRDVNGPPTFRLTPVDESISVLDEALSSGRYLSLLIERPPETLTVFRQQVVLPSKKFIFDTVQLALRGKRKPKRPRPLDIVTRMRRGSNLTVTFVEAGAPAHVGTLIEMTSLDGIWHTGTGE